MNKEDFFLDVFTAKNDSIDEDDFTAEDVFTVEDNFTAEEMELLRKLTEKKYTQDDIFYEVWGESCEPAYFEDELKMAKDYKAKHDTKKPALVAFVDNYATKFFKFCKECLNIDFKALFPKKGKQYEFPAVYALLIMELLSSFRNVKKTDNNYIAKLIRKDYKSITNEEIETFLDNYCKRLEKEFASEIQNEAIHDPEKPIASLIKTIREDMRCVIQYRVYIMDMQEQTINTIRDEFFKLMITKDLNIFPFSGINSGLNADGTSFLNLHRDASVTISNLYEIYIQEIIKKHHERYAQFLGIHVKSATDLFNNIVQEMSDDRNDLEDIVIDEMVKKQETFNPRVSIRMFLILLDEIKNDSKLSFEDKANINLLNKIIIAQNE